MKSVANNHRLVVLGIAALMTMACFCCCGPYAPYAHLITTQEPQPEDVVGIYVLTTQTLSSGNLSFLEGKQAMLELDSNGVYTATNFPIWTEIGVEYQFDRLLSTSGQWKIGTTGSVNDKTAWGVWLTPALDSLALSLDLTNNETPHGLIFTYGDPDSGNVMLFEKMK